MGKRLYKNTTSNEIFKKYTLIVAISNNKTVKCEQSELSDSEITHLCYY